MIKKKALNELDVIKLIEDNYNLEKIKEVNRILEGGSSECFHIITENGEFLFKDIEMIFMNHPENEPLINSILLENKIPVSKFYKTKYGNYIGENLGHTFHLQNFIKGKILEVNSAPGWFMDESAIMLGKIHKVLEELPMLSSGIGEEFFRIVNPENAKESYLKSLDLALKNNDKQNVEDIKYRIKLLDKIKNINLEINKFTYKNTHGDYFITQILCGQVSINAVIDFTSACVHPACYEIIRSYSYADPKCIHGKIDFENLKKYIYNYLKHSKLNKYDFKMMAYLYYYQLAVSDYFSQYYESDNTNKKVLSHYAHFSTLLCRWFEENVEELTNKLVEEFY